MLEIFNQSFMVDALLLGIALSIAAAFLSPFLVLSNQAMIADGMSHVAFAAIILGFLVSDQPLYFGIPFLLLASLAITFLSDQTNLNNDAAISVVSSLSLAIGLIVATIGSGFNRSIESLLVGSILTVTKTEVLLAFCLVTVVMVFVFVNFRSLLSMTYDLEFAKFSKVKTKALRYGLSAITALFVVVGVRTVGTLLISSFTVFPVLIASQITVGFKKTLLVGVVISMIVMFLGIVGSYYLNLPTGSTVVILYAISLAVAYLLHRLIRR